MKWKDVSSYSRDDADRSPRTFELRTGRVCVTITRWIHGDPNKWYLLCYEAGFASHRELQAAGIPEAQEEALDRVIRAFDRDLHALRECLLAHWKQDWAQLWRGVVEHARQVQQEGGMGSNLAPTKMREYTIKTYMALYRQREDGERYVVRATAFTPAVAQYESHTAQSAHEIQCRLSEQYNCEAYGDRHIIVNCFKRYGYAARKNAE